MIDWLLVIAVGALCFVASWAGTLGLIRVLTLRGILDQPNARSSHSQPMPRGGGLAVMGAVLLAWTLLPIAGPSLPGLAYIVPLAVALALVSWVDDLRGLPILLRLVLQIAAVAIGVTTLPETPIFQGLFPPWLDHALAGLAWLWFLNLYNFMDGIDGITACETVCLGTGMVVLAALGAAGTSAPFAAALIGAAFGFWWWNAQPARIFLGDVGSVPLGFVVGWMLLLLAGQGAWLPALILPAYYLADATCTVVKRLLRGDPIWQAHRDHFYQQGIKGGMSHSGVVRAVGIVNVSLIVLAAIAYVTETLPAAIGAGAAVVMLLVYLSRQRQDPPQES